jgi:hypothetical protein
MIIFIIIINDYYLVLESTISIKVKKKLKGKILKKQLATNIEIL